MPSPSLSYSIEAYAEMGRRFLPGFAAHVTDVEAAFPMLPCAPWVWPFMFHRFYSSEGDPRALHLYCHRICKLIIYGWLIIYRTCRRVKVGHRATKAEGHTKTSGSRHL